MTQFEAEEDIITRDYNEGKIDLAEYNRQMNDLHREYRDQARAAAEDAYWNEIDKW